jgi:23S rRNA (uridine2552-2'-O)-methyltransferase
MRKEKDFYFHKAKKENYPARSVYKLIEAQEKYGFLKKGKRVLDLGCHPGSWSLYAAEVLGSKGIVVGVDIQETHIDRQQPCAEINWLRQDVYSDELAEILKKQWHGFHVVLSDMAPRTTGNQYSDHQHSLRLSRRVLELARIFLYPQGTLYCKVFQGEDFPDFVRDCNELFNTVKIVKPESSRRESREVFVMGRGYKNRPLPEKT